MFIALQLSVVTVQPKTGHICPYYIMKYSRYLFSSHTVRVHYKIKSDTFPKVKGIINKISHLSKRVQQQ